MTLMRWATLGFALAIGAAGAHAQSVVSRQVDNEPVETTVTRTPGATVITRAPLAVAPASAVDMDETVGVAPDVRTTTRTTRRIVHRTSRAMTERSVTHTVHTARRVARSRPLALAPAQRQVIYRTLVQEQVVPAPVVSEVPPAVPGYPPFPPPARPVVVGPAATSGYAVSAPAEVVADEDYDYAAPVATAAPVYAVGSVLPASVAVAPLPASVAVAVPAVQPYGYATVGRRVLLVDPATDTVVADITP
jgi:hypothetical protein